MLNMTFVYLLNVSHTTDIYKIVMSTTQKLIIAYYTVASICHPQPSC